MRVLLSRLDARDRALFARWALDAGSALPSRRAWAALTHLGGTASSVLAALLPLVAGGALAGAAREACVSLAVSHLVVQAVKRTVGRPRPSRGLPIAALVAEPDRFSFPSGHATAALAVALAYALAFPLAGLVLLPVAFLVGCSRVVLGVHYPGDVLVGQAIAVTTGLAVHLAA